MSRFKINEEGKLVETHEIVISPVYRQFVQALADVAGISFDEQISEQLAEYWDYGETPEERLAEQQARNRYEFASAIMSEVVRDHGEFYLCDTEQEYREQENCWRLEQGCLLFQHTSACALDLDGAGAKKHFQELVKLCGWDNE